MVKTLVGSSKYSSMETDRQRVSEIKKKIILCAAKDVEHIGNPLKQIETLSLIVDQMLKDNENGKYDALIGFYANIGKSLVALLKFHYSRQKYGKYRWCIIL